MRKVILGSVLAVSFLLGISGVASADKGIGAPSGGPAVTSPAPAGSTGKGIGPVTPPSAPTNPGGGTSVAPKPKGLIITSGHDTSGGDAGGISRVQYSSGAE